MRFVVALVTIAVLGGAGLIAAQYVGDDFIEQQARNVANDRFGADIEIGDVALQRREVVFRQISLPLDQLAAPLHIRELRVRPHLQSALAGKVQLEAVSISGITVMADAAGIATTAQQSVESGSDNPATRTNSASAQLTAYMQRLRDMLSNNGSVAINEAKIRLGHARAPLRVQQLLLRRDGGELITEGLVHAGDGKIVWDIDIDPAHGRARGMASIGRFPLAVVAPLLPDNLIRDASATMVNGDLQLHEVDGNNATITANVTLQELSIDSERIAEQTVGPMNLSLRGMVRWNLGDNIFEFDRIHAGLNDAHVEVSGRVRPDDDTYLVDLTAALNTTSCNELFGAFPAALYGPYDGFRWSGNITGNAVLKVDANNLDDTEFDVDLANGCRFTQWPNAVRVSRLKQPFTHTVPGRGDRELSILVGPGSRNWTPIEAISPYLLQAVLAHEDAGFFRHPGFAEYAIETALEKNLERERFAFGASTISMQLAKNLYLTRDKTIVRKLREALLTWWLEDQLSKDEILELYVNVIEYGPELYGITAAAERYFGVHPADLSLAQSVYLATVLPAPSRYYRRNFAVDGLSSSTRNEIEFLMRHMERKGRITAEAHRQGRMEVANFAFEPSPNRWQPGMTASLPIPQYAGRYAAVRERRGYNRYNASERPPSLPNSTSSFKVERVCGWHYPCQ